MQKDISLHIFRAYDIRGIYQKDISPELFFKIGQAAGTFAKRILRGKNLTVGADIRQSSPSLFYSFISGVSSTGIDVQYTGITSFGQTLFAGWQNKHEVIAFITASHLPAEWNGIKFYYGDGVGFSVDDLEQIRDFTLDDDFEIADWQTVGKVKKIDISKVYRDFFLSKFSYTSQIKVALDCGGASMTLSAPDVFTSLGLDCVPVFCEPDPLFSKRPSEPKEKNLGELVKTVREQKCDFGVAFDGDGDRAVIVDNKGRVLSADQTGIILGKFGISDKKGVVLVNVEVSKAVKEQLEPLGFQVNQIRVGHTFLTLEGKKQKARLGIESSGHIILPEYFLFDDALVVPLKMAEVLDKTDAALSALVDELPMYLTNREEINCPDDIKSIVIDELTKELIGEFNNTNVLDGIRVTLEKGWVLIRQSNTSPIIRLTAEADDHSSLGEITTTFMKKLKRIIDKKKTPM
ncbi:MAG: hypothetical protein R6V50_05610 [Thermoplasmatota archaeon]